jgi:hypothetical protein
MVTDRDEVDGSDHAAGGDPRRLLQIRRHVESPRTVIAGTEREDCELAAAGPVQPLCRLADRAVTTRDHDSPYTVGNRCGRELGCVPRGLGEDDRCGEAPLAESFGDFRPLAAQAAAIRRRIDDDFHGRIVTDTTGAGSTRCPVGIEPRPSKFPSDDV